MAGGFREGPIEEALAQASLVQRERYQVLEINEFQATVRRLVASFLAGSTTWQDLIDGINGAARRMGNDGWTAEG
jgi:hypothetical protein